MNIFKITLFVFILFPITLHAQDPEFTQFYSTPLYLNPSFAGSAGCSRVALNYRNEWPTISGTNQTFHLSYDQYVHPLRGGIGYETWYDIAGGGTLNTYYNGLIYSPKFKIKDKFSIAPSIKFGYCIKTLNWDKLTFGDMIDPRYGFIYETEETKVSNPTSFIDISPGILINSRKFHLGFAVDHINQPKEGFIVADNAKLPARLTFHLGYVYQEEDNSKFNFSHYLLLMKQQNFQMLILATSFSYKFILWGIAYRQAGKNSDAIIALVGFQHRWIKFGYSYDITLSRLSNASTGSHEVSLKFLFNCKNKEDKIIRLTNIAF